LNSLLSCKRSKNLDFPLISRRSDDADTILFLFLLLGGLEERAEKAAKIPGPDQKLVRGYRD
jgi:hypothetical protein